MKSILILALGMLIGFGITFGSIITFTDIITKHKGVEPISSFSGNILESERYELAFSSISQTCALNDPITNENDSFSGGGSCSTGIGHGYAKIIDGNIHWTDGKIERLDLWVLKADKDDSISYSIVNCDDKTKRCFTWDDESIIPKQDFWRELNDEEKQFGDNSIWNLMTSKAVNDFAHACDKAGGMVQFSNDNETFQSTISCIEKQNKSVNEN